VAREERLVARDDIAGSHRDAGLQRVDGVDEPKRGSVREQRHHRIGVREHGS
jgi:hypothetical protein